VSSEQVSQKAKEALKSLKEVLERAEDTTHKVLEKAAPTLQRSIDSSMEAASNGFNATMKSIDGATVGDQIKLLRAYRKFLAGQADFVESRIRALEEAKASKPGASEKP